MIRFRAVILLFSLVACELVACEKRNLNLQSTAVNPPEKILRDADMTRNQKVDKEALLKEAALGPKTTLVGIFKHGSYKNEMNEVIYSGPILVMENGQTYKLSLDDPKAKKYLTLRNKKVTVLGHLKKPHPRASFGLPTLFVLHIEAVK